RDHPYVRSYLEHRRALRGLGNALHVAVENRRGDVYDPAYLDALREISDELFLTPGVDRAWVKSLWTPAVRWTEVTEEGFRGGPVMPDDYDGSPASLAALRRNVARAGLSGSLVARDARSSLVFVPLLDRDPVTGEGIDYQDLSRRLEALRLRFEGPHGEGSVRLHVVGFARLVGALMEGIRQVMAWFAAAAAIAAASLLLYTRCLRSTALVIACATVGVIWQVGAVSAMGLALDPFTVLTPFLVFAMGVSHGAQKMNGILQDVGRGTHRLVAARRTFRRLFSAGLTAVLTDVVGFAALAVIDVPAIRELALTAAVGATGLVVTSLVLLPVLLSYTGVSPAAARRSLRAEDPAGRPAPLWRLLERFTAPRWAAGAVLAAAAVIAAGVLAGRDVEVGALRPGAPELRAASRYNQDDAYLAAHYAVSSDVFAVIVRTGPEGCLDHRTLVEADRLGWALQQLPGVRATASLPDAVRQITAGSYEGDPRWLTLSRNQQVLNHAGQQAITRNPDLFDADCAVQPVVAYLADRRAETLDRVVGAAEAFATAHGDGERAFLLAAGSAGIEAATNQVVRRAGWTMTLLAYAAVILLSLATFRSWRAVLVAVIPLAVVSVLCNALMARLHIGMTLATLPVIALGVGIPDYALYLVTVQLAHQRAGASLEEAHRRSLRFTGRAVVLVSVTLAGGVVTWCASPIQLQADMGLLLTFMFLANMAAALVLVPALSRFLLAGVGRAAEPALGQGVGAPE
ncbi:MAG TPA: MMPL family transporter, partial [Anaeromyxobacteraceae bacterium]|nr:MMPL family transporter [Anaeromyxobacteraceae bacterium]